MKLRRRLVPAVATLVAAMLLLGAAAARTSVTVTVGPDGAHAHVETDDVPRLPALPPRDNDTPTRDTFWLAIDPPFQEVEPGGEAWYAVHLGAKRNVTLDLRVANATRGFAAELGAHEVALAPGQNATVRLRVVAPDYETYGAVVVEARARDTGERHEAHAKLAVKGASASLSMAIDPANQTARPGDSVVYAIWLKSTEDRTVHLNVTRLPRGYTAELSASSVHAGPSHVARVNLTVHVPSNATEGGTIGVLAWTPEGERAYAEATVKLEEVWATSRSP